MSLPGTQESGTQAGKRIVAAGFWSLIAVGGLMSTLSGKGVGPLLVGALAGWYAVYLWRGGSVVIVLLPIWIWLPLAGLTAVGRGVSRVLAPAPEAARPATLRPAAETALLTSSGPVQLTSRPGVVVDQQLTEEAPVAVCPSCGTTLHPEGKFCGYCGKPAAAGPPPVSSFAPPPAASAAAVTPPAPSPSYPPEPVPPPVAAPLTLPSGPFGAETVPVAQIQALRAASAAPQPAAPQPSTLQPGAPQPAAPQPAVVQPAAPSTLRGDLLAGLSTARPDVQGRLREAAQGPLAMLSANLPDDETVRYVTGGASDFVGDWVNSVIALTSHRLLFVSPGPIVLTLPLARITRTYLARDDKPVRYFVVEEGALECKMGIDGSGADEFKGRLDVAVAEARISTR